MARKENLNGKKETKGSFQLVTLLEQLNEGVYLIDPKGNLIEVSDSLVKFSGCKSKQELLSTDVAEEFYLDSKDRERFLRQLKKKGKLTNLKIAYRKRTGEITHCLESAVTLRDDKGKVVGYQGVIRDITEKKKLEEELKRKKDYLENILFNAIPAAVFIVDPEKRILNVNREFERLLGYRRHEVIGKECEILGSEECFRQCSLFDLKVEKPVYGSQGYFFTKDGRRITVLKSINLIRDDKGEIIGGIEAFIDVSNMKRTEERLKLFHQAFSASMDGMCIADIDGRILEVNEAFSDIWDYTREEALKMRISDLWAPEQLDIIMREVIPRTLKGGWVGELIGVKKNKERFIAELRSGLVRDDKGNAIALLASLHDVSIRKLLEQETQLIQEINLRLNSGEELSRVIRMICEGAQAIYHYRFFDLLLLSDDKKELIYTYSTMEAITNTKIKELTGLEIVGLRIPLFPESKLRKIVMDKRPLFSSGMMEVTELVKDFTDQQKLKPAASMIAVVLGCDHIMNVPITAGDKVLGLVNIGSNRPLAEEDLIKTRGFLDQIGVALGRRKLEEEIARSKAYLENLIENMGEGLIVTDNDNRVILVNRMAETILNIKSEELLGKSTHPYLKPETRKRMDALFTKFKTGFIKKQKSHEMKIESDKKVIRANITPIISEPQGEFLGTALILQDITRLAEIDRMKTDFVSAVSHELRTPLASITGFAATILNDPAMEAETKNEFLKIILDEGKRLSRLINNLLDIQKIESGRVSITKVWFDLPELCQDVLEKLKPRTEKKKLSLALESSPEVGRVFADPDQMEQVMTNLITNSLKFTPEEGKISIRLRRDKGMIRVEVEDSGMGIPEEEIPRVFDRFHRVHRPGMEIPGTGLGLSIVKDIIEKHRGKIFLKSKPGIGTKVTFLIPEKEGKNKKG